MSALLARVHQASVEHAERADRTGRRGIGQFFTPAAVAAFMASLLPPSSGAVRLIDPGAGTGILGIAAAERLLQSGATSVHLVAVERDPEVSSVLANSLSIARSVLGGCFSYEIRDDDFLDYGMLLRPPEQFDIVIANPPYQKMSPSDPRGGGSPNAYTRFMEIAANLLGPSGILCFIIPRSYASGLYFRRFRQQFHRNVHLSRVHLFGSRRDAFRSDDVLQESVIVIAGKADVTTVTVSRSEGIADLDSATSLELPTRRVVDVTTPEAWLHLPESSADLDALRAVEALPGNLGKLGLAISTGAVVPFRSRPLLVDLDGDGYPLLWMHHVRRGGLNWPLDGLKKPQRIARQAPGSLLLRRGNYVLLRRFSAKDDRNRLVAAMLPGEAMSEPFFAVENHVNVIQPIHGGEFRTALARGVERLLNSELYERYFRVVNGNTQVSATEIRATAFPNAHVVEQIGSSDLPVEECLEDVLRATA